MKSIVLAAVLSLVVAPAQAQALTTAAADPYALSQFTASDGAFLVQSSQRNSKSVWDPAPDEVPKPATRVMANPRAPETALTVALGRAWKRGFIVEGVEESRKVLLECQRETSVAWTTPFMRSDAQQDHCYRF
ncbi:hypothetical protein H3H36_12455 [Duganella sp. FT3S]|uniref:Uncharacterized protein n=1 Tax=Rugamonas fusca TaxID=2758568 RepID=A0A7W2EHY1_9BURK|nr:hypothetical protein [Rugamonas fusca]MBA5606164.1 hypothetical protein [Rugamonas fusca]